MTLNLSSLIDSIFIPVSSEILRPQVKKIKIIHKSLVLLNSFFSSLIELITFSDSDRVKYTGFFFCNFGNSNFSAGFLLINSTVLCKYLNQDFIAEIFLALVLVESL